MAVLRPVGLTALAVVVAPGLALGQVTTLKNDSLTLPFPPAPGAPVAISPGFAPGQKAAAVFDVPPSLLPLRVNAVGVLWYSQFSAQVGPELFPATNLIHDGFEVFIGEPPNARLIYQSDPGLFAGEGYNVTSLLADQVDISEATRITVALVFDTTTGAETGAPNNVNPPEAATAFDLVSRASVAYDLTGPVPPQTAEQNANNNWIFTQRQTLTSTGMRSGWIRYRDLRAAGAPTTPPQGFDLALRLFVEPAPPPPPPLACNVADIVSIGGFPPADGELTVDDYTSFINAFAGDELLADIVEIGGFPPSDGQLTVDDYTSFINAFAEGCPG